MSSHPGTSPARLRTRFFDKAKSEGAPFSCLTSYDCMTAAVFDEAGIDLLLVGDSLANVVLGRETTLSLTKEVSIPTIGIGAGNACDEQILVWTDAFGMGAGKTPRFVRRYADLRGMLAEAARSYAADVHSRAFPNEAESFSD